MKLFVWQGVLRDYSAGMIVALAPSLDAALRHVRSHPEKFSSQVAADMGTETPEVVTLTGCAPKRTKVWYVFGGG